MTVIIDGTAGITFNNSTTQAVAALPLTGGTLTGNLVIGSGANGITFPATQSASSDANTLDDYEEGTWSPTLGGNATYSNQQGNYIKIGAFVYVVGIIVVSSLGTGSTTTITGLPFTTATQDERYGGSIAYFGGLATNALNLLVFSNNNSTTVQFSVVTSAGANLTTDTAAVWGNGAHIQFSLCYRV
jgi:hypothetical protein